MNKCVALLLVAFCIATVFAGTYTVFWLKNKQKKWWIDVGNDVIEFFR